MDGFPLQFAQLCIIMQRCVIMLSEVDIPKVRVTLESSKNCILGVIISHSDNLIWEDALVNFLYTCVLLLKTQKHVMTLTKAHIFNVKFTVHSQISVQATAFNYGNTRTATPVTWISIKLETF